MTSFSGQSNSTLLGCFYDLWSPKNLTWKLKFMNNIRNFLLRIQIYISILIKSEAFKNTDWKEICDLSPILKFIQNSKIKKRPETQSKNSMKLKFEETGKNTPTIFVISLFCFEYSNTSKIKKKIANDWWQWWHQWFKFFVWDMIHFLCLNLNIFLFSYPL